MEHLAGGGFLSIVVVLSVCLCVLAGCATGSGFLDVITPDTFGTGTAFGKGHYSARSLGGDGAVLERGNYDENPTAKWLEWSIPSWGEGGKDTSFAGIRERVVEDYRELRAPEPPKESLISITKSVDEHTGDESWSFGVSEALNSALLALASWLGFRAIRNRASISAEGEGEG